MPYQNLLANRVANIAFAGKVFVLRTSVYKKRAAQLRKVIKDILIKGGDKIEAYPYAMGILMMKNQINFLLDTSNRIKNFVDFTIAHMADGKKLPPTLLDRLTKFDHSVLRAGILATKHHLDEFDKEFLASGDLDDTMRPPRLPKIRVSRKNALEEINKVKSTIKRESRRKEK